MLVKLLNDFDTSADAYVYAYTNTHTPAINHMRRVCILTRS